MRRIAQAGGIAVAIIALWFGMWSWLMAADVARVKASIDVHYQRFHTMTRVMQFPVSIKADAVYATGFPFKFQVAVKNLTLSTVEMNETFAVSAHDITLQATDSDQGIYRVNLPDTVEALYAKDGSAPEHYRVSVDAVPKLNLSAADSKVRCGFGTGKACEAVAAKAPLISYALSVPQAVTLHMELGNDSRDERFPLSPLAIDVPIYQEIPMDISTPLTIFVGVLREGLVYRTKSETPQ